MLRALALALAVHALMALLVFLGTFNWKPFRQIAALKSVETDHIEESLSIGHSWESDLQISGGNYVI